MALPSSRTNREHDDRLGTVLHNSPLRALAPYSLKMEKTALHVLFYFRFQLRQITYCIHVLHIN